MANIRALCRLPMVPLVLVGMLIGAAWYCFKTGFDMTKGN